MIASSATSALSNAPASFAVKPRSTTSFSPCPTARVQPAATSSAIPATTKRRRYGAKKLPRRESVRTTGRRAGAEDWDVIGQRSNASFHYRGCTAQPVVGPPRYGRILAIAPVAQWIEQPPPKG